MDTPVAMAVSPNAVTGPRLYKYDYGVTRHRVDEFVGTAKRQEELEFLMAVLPLEFPVSRDADKGEFLDAITQEI